MPAILPASVWISFCARFETTSVHDPLHYASTSSTATQVHVSPHRPPSSPTAQRSAAIFPRALLSAASTPLPNRVNAPSKTCFAAQKGIRHIQETCKRRAKNVKNRIEHDAYARKKAGDLERPGNTPLNKSDRSRGARTRGRPHVLANGSRAPSQQ